MPLFPVIAEAWREVTRGLFDPYRPEGHYMRGPGPKWRERQRVASQFGPAHQGRIQSSDAREQRAAAYARLRFIAR